MVRQKKIFLKQVFSKTFFFICLFFIMLNNGNLGNGDTTMIRQLVQISVQISTIEISEVISGPGWW